SNDRRGPYWNRERFIREYREMAEQYMDLPIQPDVYLVIPPYVPTSRVGFYKKNIENEIKKN
ncbi:esterase, partial [Streptococcus suis]